MTAPVESDGGTNRLFAIPCGPVATAGGVSPSYLQFAPRSGPSVTQVTTAIKDARAAFGGGLRPSLTAATARVLCMVRPGRRNGVQPNKETAQEGGGLGQNHPRETAKGLFGSFHRPAIG